VRRFSTLTPIDGLLLLMVLIWGSNFSLIKAALVHIPSQQFNALRLTVATAVFLCAVTVKGWPAIPRRDWLMMAGIGFIGHFVYQLCFVGGLSLSTASNSSLILGVSPVAVAVASAMAGHERLTKNQMIGAVLSVGGIYFVVGTGAHFSGTTLAGDLITLCGVGCWAVYTVASRALLERYTPLVVTGVTMALGSAIYVPAAIPGMLTMNVGAVPVWVWVAVVFSSFLALNVAYLIWYTAVQRIGNIRTSVYSNVTPLVAITVAATFLGERITMTTLVGAAAILGGVFVTRKAAGAKAEGPPAEE